MRRSNKPGVLIEYVLICNVESFATPQVMVRHLWWFVSIYSFAEKDIAALDEAPCCRIIAITGQEVVVKFPEDV